MSGGSRLKERAGSRPGSPHGGAAEKVFTQINGVRQGMFIQCQDAAHPVLLYLHGGLGIVWPALRSPQYTPNEKLRLLHGKLSWGVSALWSEMLATDLAERVPALALPASPSRPTSSTARTTTPSVTSWPGITLTASKRR